MKRHIARSTLLVAATTLFVASPLVQAVDADAAKALAKQNNCFKCHAIEKEKDAPPTRRWLKSTGAKPMLKPA